MALAPLEKEIDLAVLARRLALEGMPPQTVVAAECGVSQPTVSRAMRGQIRGATRSVRKLWRYTEERLAILEAPPAEAERSWDLPDSEPVRTSQTGSAGVDEPPRSRAAAMPRLKSTAPDAELPESQETLAQVALDGLKYYLQDKFDPQLVIEQLAVLRRAQDHARRRASGD